MANKSNKARFIRDEFDCFVQIGMNPSLRNRVKKAIEKYVLEDHDQLTPPTLYLEARDEEGNLRQIYQIEPDGNQLLRLLEFLHRFSVDDVRLINSLMRRK